MFDINNLSESIKEFYKSEKYSLYSNLLEAGNNVFKNAAAAFSNAKLPSRDPTADPGRRVPGASSKLRKMRPTSGPNASTTSGPGAKPASITDPAKKAPAKKQYMGPGDVISNKAVVTGTKIADLEKATQAAAKGDGRVLGAILEPHISRTINMQRAEDHFRDFIADPTWVGFSKRTKKKIGNAEPLKGGWLVQFKQAAQDALAKYEASKGPQSPVGDPGKIISYMTRNIHYAKGRYRSGVMTPWEMENEGLEIENEDGKTQERGELAKDDNVGQKRAEMREKLTVLFNDAFVHGVKDLHKDPSMDEYYKNIAKGIIFRDNGTIRYRQLIRDPETGIGQEERNDRKIAEKVYHDMVERGKGLNTHNSPQDFSNSANRAMQQTIKKMGSYLETNMSPEEYKDLEDFVKRTAGREKEAKSEFQKARAAEKAEIGAKMAKSRGQARKVQKGQSLVDKDARKAAKKAEKEAAHQARMAELRKAFDDISKKLGENIVSGTGSYLAEFVGTVYGVNKDYLNSAMSFRLLAEFMDSLEED